MTMDRKLAAAADGELDAKSAARASWDARFNQAGFLFGLEPNRFLVAQRHRLTPASRILSVADGEGRNSVWLAQQGMSVVAFDFSPVAVDKARRLAAEQGVSVDYRVATVDEWDWQPAAFDAVVAIFVQFAPPDRRARLFAGMQRTLKPGGLLLVQGYTPRQLIFRTGGPDRADQLYTSQLLRELLHECEIVELLEHEAELAEGCAHFGRSALLDCVARKRSGAAGL